MTRRAVMPHPERLAVHVRSISPNKRSRPGRWIPWFFAVVGAVLVASYARWWWG